MSGGDRVKNLARTQRFRHQDYDKVMNAVRTEWGDKTAELVRRYIDGEMAVDVEPGNVKP